MKSVNASVYKQGKQKTMRCILGILLSMALAFYMLPVNALTYASSEGRFLDARGADADQTNAVVKIEKDGALIGYVDENGLDSAFADSGNTDATITLLKDVTRTERINIKINCTLDLDKYTIRNNGSGSSVFIYYGTKVTIRGEGKIVSEQCNALDVGGSATLEGGVYISGGKAFCGVYVNSGDAELSVTGEKVSIQNTGGGYGLGVNLVRSVQLSAGTYCGGSGTISISDNVSDLVLGGLLARAGDTRYAYYNENGELIKGKLKETALYGMVTVKECGHDYAYTHTEGATAHGASCAACGDEKSDEKCSFDEAGKCPCGAVLAVKLEHDPDENPDSEPGVVYNGAPQKPGVTVTVDGIALSPDDYKLDYADNVNAGTNTASVTVSSAKFNGMAQKRFSIAKAKPSIAWDAANQNQTLVYNANPAQIAAPAVTLAGGEAYDSNVHGEIQYSYALKGSGADTPGLPADAGEYTVFASIAERGNYTAAESENTLTLTIQKAQGALTVPEKKIEKAFGDGEFSLNCSSNGDGSITYDSDNTGVIVVSKDGKAQIKGVGSAQVTVSLAQGTNHTAADSQTIEIAVAKGAAPADIKETRNYAYAKGSNGAVKIDVAGKLPINRGKTRYTAALADEKGILSDVVMDENGSLTFQVLGGRSEGETAFITVTAEMENYENAAYTLEIALVDKIKVQFAFTENLKDSVYDGKPHDGYAALAAETINGGYTGEMQFHYEGTGETSYSDSKPPVRAGSYAVTVRVPESETEYAGVSDPLPFTIQKAAIKIKADDKSAQANGPLPELTYTVSGLAENESLAAPPQLSTNADMKKPGGYLITADGAKVPDTDNYQEEIAYENGTLTVLEAESGGNSGGTGSGSGGGSFGGSGSGGSLGSGAGNGSGGTGNGSSTGKNQPFLKDSFGREGWDAIRAEAKKAAEDSKERTVAVVMNGAAFVPASVFEAIRGNDVTLSFDMGDGVIWSVDGKDITAETVNDTDFSVKIVKTEESAVPKELIKNLIEGTAPGLSHLELSLSHNGPFGFTATLTLQIGNSANGVMAGGAAEYAGMYANLFYYNPALGRLEFVCAGKVGEDGAAHLPFTHASDYTLILSAQPMGGAGAPGETLKPGDAQGPDGEEKPQKPGKQARVKSVKLSKTVYTYNGKAKKPSVTAVDTDGKKIPKRYYKIVYQNNRKAGKATAIVRFQGAYSGTVKKAFTIRLAGCSVKKIKAVSGAFTAQWTKDAQADGYQLQYSLDKRFQENSARSLYVKKASITKKKASITKKKTFITKKTVKNRKAGRKYYVRVRAYKTVKSGGKNTKIYSAWSKAVRVNVS